MTELECIQSREQAANILQIQQLFQSLGNGENRV